MKYGPKPYSHEEEGSRAYHQSPEQVLLWKERPKREKSRGHMTEYDPLEKLTLLAAHAIDLRPTPSAHQRLTPMDIAGRLAKVSRGASLLGRVKIAGQGELVPDLIRCLRTAVVESHMPWPSKKMTLLPIMVQTALLEVIDPRTCKTCRGVGQFMIDAKPVTCEDCQGGKYAWTEFARARSCGLHHEAWKRTYSRPYLEILSIVWGWESDVRDALKA